MCVRARPQAVFYVSEKLFGFSCFIAVKCEMHEMFQQKESNLFTSARNSLVNIVREGIANPHVSDACTVRFGLVVHIWGNVK